MAVPMLPLATLSAHVAIDYYILSIQITGSLQNLGDSGLKKQGEITLKDQNGEQAKEPDLRHTKVASKEAQTLKPADKHNDVLISKLSQSKLYSIEYSLHGGRGLNIIIM